MAPMLLKTFVFIKKLSERGCEVKLNVIVKKTYWGQILLKGQTSSHPPPMTILSRA
jgi:hypothetical protein